MLDTLRCVQMDWSAIGAVTTAVGIIVALGIAVIPAWRAKIKAEALAHALFGHDILHVLVATHGMSSPTYVHKLKDGELPSERQKRALSMPSMTEHMSSLQFSTELTESVVQLMRQCSDLLWFIQNLANPDIDYERGVCIDADKNRAANCLLVVSQAKVVNSLAKKVQFQLYKPSRWQRLQRLIIKRSVYSLSLIISIDFG